MVKLTADLIYMSSQYVNACGDRELCLRGYRIPIIENLGATLDQFNTIDFSDNDIRKLDGFPYFKNLSILLFNNNSIGTISNTLHTCIPNLEILVLTGNLISNCSQLNALSSFKYLRVLSLMGNPVTKLPYYRSYVAYHIPQVKVLDFKKIKMKERSEAQTFFTSKEGKEIRHTVHKSIKEEAKKQKIQKNKDFTSTELSKIMAAIDKASTLDQIDQLQDLLLAGKIPDNLNTPAKPNGVVTGKTEEENEDVESNDDRVSIASGDFNITNKMDQDGAVGNEMYSEEYDYVDGETYPEADYAQNGNEGYGHDGGYQQDGDYSHGNDYAHGEGYPQDGTYPDEQMYAEQGDYQNDGYVHDDKQHENYMQVDEADSENV